MIESARRHDLSDAAWRLLELHLPGQSGRWGGIAHDNRRFLDAVFWILRTGAPWRDLPASYGDWKNTHRRFCRWRDRGVWERLLEQIIDEPDMEWLMIDASHCKVHPIGRVVLRFQSLVLPGSSEAYSLHYLVTTLSKKKLNYVLSAMAITQHIAPRFVIAKKAPKPYK